VLCGLVGVLGYSENAPADCHWKDAGVSQNYAVVPTICCILGPLLCAPAWLVQTPTPADSTARTACGRQDDSLALPLPPWTGWPSETLGVLKRAPLITSVVRLLASSALAWAMQIEV
jgi:hypothetical protein